MNGNLRQITLCFLFLTVTGCVAFHHIGRKGVKWDAIEDTNLISAGKSIKSDVEKHFGESNVIRKEGQEEIWTYHLERGFYIVVYGTSEYKNLIIRFDAATGVVKEYKYLRVGESTGIFVPPGGAR